RAAFTLIELLVVVAIIGILAAMLLPALSQARAKGQAAACVGNMREIGIAMEMYESDFNGWLPPAATTGGKSFDRLLSSYIDGGINDPPVTPDSRWAGVWKCPADRLPHSGGPSNPPRSYAMNIRL